jgi:hypothetical protein
MMVDRWSLMVELLDVESVFPAGGGVTILLKADDDDDDDNDAVVELFNDTADVVESVKYADISGAAIVSTTVTGVGVASSGIWNSVAVSTKVDVSPDGAVMVRMISPVIS